MTERVETEIVKYRVSGRTALITLNRAHVRNAVDASMASAIERALDRAENDDDIWIIVITGEGDVFCAGADLKAVAAGQSFGIDTLRGGFAGLVRRNRRKPLIAAVNGPALAGGCEVVLASDLVVAATTATFGLPEVKHSLLASAGGLMRLPHTIPLNVAMEMALTGEPISAARAASFGMVNVCCAREDVVDEALTLAERIAVNAPLAVRASRQVLIDSYRVDEETGWDIGNRSLDALFETEDFKEGPRAFVEKRAPRWTGR